jgi:hypothetical protein
VSHDEAVELAKRWLRSKHTTLWMDWDLTSDTDLHEAGTWFIDNMNSLLDFVDSDQADLVL